MIVFRLSKSKYARDLSGRGAEKSGARWNSKGVPMVYTGASRALCTAEIAVHTPLGNIPEDYMIVTLELPEDAVLTEILMSQLPADWKSIPHTHSTQRMGDHFVVNGKHLVMKVPSVVVQGDYNFLLNPLHRDFNRIKILDVAPFSFDERLFVR